MLQLNDITFGNAAIGPAITGSTPASGATNHVHTFGRYRNLLPEVPGEDSVSGRRARDDEKTVAPRFGQCVRSAVPASTGSAPLIDDAASPGDPPAVRGRPQPDVLAMAAANLPLGRRKLCAYPFLEQMGLGAGRVRGLTQQGVADFLELARTTATALEKGEGRIRPDDSNQSDTRDHGLPNRVPRRPPAAFPLAKGAGTRRWSWDEALQDFETIDESLWRSESSRIPRGKGRPIPTNDVWIAAHVPRHGDWSRPGIGSPPGRIRRRASAKPGRGMSFLHWAPPVALSRASGRGFSGSWPWPVKHLLGRLPRVKGP